MSKRGHGELLAPWRCRSGQMYLTDREILTEFENGSVRKPVQLAEGRRRENVIRLQCHYLSDIGLLRTVGRDSFEITTFGSDYLDGSVLLPTEDGYILLEETMEIPSRSLTDFTSLDPTLIKIINDDFFVDSSNDYGWVRGDRKLTEQRIWNVKGWQLDRIMEEFPRTDPLPQQCAHWIRTIVGIHFFPDANHRTGMATLYGLLDANDVAQYFDEWPGSGIDRAVLYSKLIRSLVTTVTFDKLWLRDELYCHWERYFSDLLSGETNHRSQPTNDDLREVLRYVRDKRNR